MLLIDGQYAFQGSECEGMPSWRHLNIDAAPETLDINAFSEAVQPSRRGGWLEVAAGVEHPVHADARVHGAAGQDLCRNKLPGDS